MLDRFLTNEGDRNGKPDKSVNRRTSIYVKRKRKRRIYAAMQSILLAINIVEDLLKEKKNVEEEKKRVLALTEENKKLQREIEKTRQELEEYLKVLNAE